jgi:hypothetical protein
MWMSMVSMLVLVGWLVEESKNAIVIESEPTIKSKSNIKE